MSPRVPARSICLVRLSAIGDVVHALALANGLRRGYPGAKITWIIQPLPWEVVREQPAIDEFILFDPRRGRRAWADLRRRLAKEKFDLAVVPQVSFKAGLITRHIDAPVKLGFDFRRSRELSWLFMNRRIPAKPAQHVQDQFLEFLDYLEIPREPVEWNIRFTPDEEAEAAQFFAAVGRPVISLVLASSLPEKDWTPEGYAAVADHFTRRGFAILLVGGPSAREQTLAAAVMSTMQEKAIPALDRPLRTTLWKLRGSRVVVSPDTGPLHAAIAMDVPTVALHGYSNPRRCGPYRYRDLLVDRYTTDETADTPIRRRTKKGRTALITPGEVISKVEEALERYVTPN